MRQRPGANPRVCPAALTQGPLGCPSFNFTNLNDMQQPGTTNEASTTTHADTTDVVTLSAILREELINPWGLPPLDEESPPVA